MKDYAVWIYCKNNVKTVIAVLQHVTRNGVRRCFLYASQGIEKLPSRDQVEFVYEI